MAENKQESQELATSSKPEASKEDDKQSMLLKLAERTVVQAEALAQEITDHAKHESQAAGAKIISEATDKAKSEAKQAVEAAKRRAEAIVNDANNEVQEESERGLNVARTESEKMVGQAKIDSEKTVNKARADSEKMLTRAKNESEAARNSAQADSQEVVGKARQDAQAILNAARSRAESLESNAKLKAEFLIRQTTQSVADGIRSSVLEICNSLLPAVEQFAKDGPASLNADDRADDAASQTPMLESAEPVKAHSTVTNGAKSKSSSKKSLAS